LQKEKMREVGF